MKEKILALLKQEYSHLGLGDAILTAQAESLANSNLVTDENLETIVKAQKAFLEALQKGNDKRVNDAVKTAREAVLKEVEEAKKKAAEDEKKKVEEAKKKQEAKEINKTSESKKESEGNEPPAWLEGLLKKYEDSATESRKTIEKLTNDFTTLKEEYDGAKAEAKKNARAKFITDKAKELGIPQYRIDEGFAFGEDKDEAAISESLATIANNIKVNQLPQDKRFMLGNDKPSKEEVDSIAKALVL